jgi:lipoprotein LpqH
VVKRGFTVTVAGAGIVVTALAGCSSNNSSTPSSSSSATSSSSSSSSSSESSPTSSSAAASSAAGAGQTKVTIDGQDQNVQGQVLCTTAAGNLNIVIGAPPTGVVVTLTTADPPQVTNVALGNVNGVSLGYTGSMGGMSQGNAAATKDGSSYKITGTASGVDMANPGTMVTKPFEIDVTCP